MTTRGALTTREHTPRLLTLCLPPLRAQLPLPAAMSVPGYVPSPNEDVISSQLQQLQSILEMDSAASVPSQAQAQPSAPSFGMEQHWQPAQQWMQVQPQQQQMMVSGGQQPMYQSQQQPLMQQSQPQLSPAPQFQPQQPPLSAAQLEQQQTAAATKIQSVQRGRAARKQAKKDKHQQQQQGDSSSSSDDNAAASSDGSSGSPLPLQLQHQQEGLMNVYVHPAQQYVQLGLAIPELTGELAGTLALPLQIVSHPRGYNSVGDLSVRANTLRSRALQSSQMVALSASIDVVHRNGLPGARGLDGRSGSQGFGGSSGSGGGGAGGHGGRGENGAPA